MKTKVNAIKVKRNSTLERKLLAYSAAALVAVAVPGRALAAVQYNDEDPDVVVGAGGTYDIDFDGDGNPEFRLRQATNGFTDVVQTTYTTTTFTCYPPMNPYDNTWFCVTDTYTHTNTFTDTFTGNKVDVIPLSNAGDVGSDVVTNGGYAAALNTGQTISSGAGFQPGSMRVLAGQSAFSSVGTASGPFRGQNDKFLGLSFQMDGGDTHYGWVRLDVNNDASGFTVKDFAYESDAGAPIVTFDPTAVTLAGFTATPSDAGVLLQWETVSEVDHAGFNLLRGTDATAAGEVVNETLIAAEAPGSTTGAAYQWLDATADAGTTYYYWLEAVDVSGGTERFGPVSATIQAPTAVSLSTLSANTSTLPQWQWTAFGVVALGALLRRRVARRRRMRQRVAGQQLAQ